MLVISNLFAVERAVPQKVALLGVPYGGTVSFRKGTHLTPLYLPYIPQFIDFSNILEPLSPLPSVDYFILEELLPYHYRMMLKMDEFRGLLKFNTYIDRDETFRKACDTISGAVLSLKEKGYFPCMLGGEHTSSLGMFHALSPSISSIIVIDSHLDLRDSYEECKYSHACFLRRALEFVGNTRVVVLGASDFSEEEYEWAIKNNVRVITSLDIARAINEGKAAYLIGSILEQLNPPVYISVDIDGLEPQYGLSCGTPVPGGIPFQLFLFLLLKIKENKIAISGFDLCEVAPSQEVTPHHDLNLIMACHILVRMLALTI